MDDLEFRRRLLSDPNDHSTQVIEKIRSNSHDRKYAESLTDLDNKIEQAMKVDVPDDLADKIIFSTSKSKPQINMTKKAFALAASVIFTVGLMVGQVNWGALIITPAHARLDSMAIHHIHEEAPFIKDVNEANNAQEMQAKLGTYSYALTSAFPYHIYYLNHCGFSPDHHALHMVFQGKKGRVTAFISNIAAPNASDFAKDGMKGTIIPLPQGSLVVVGNENEDISSIATKLAPMFVLKS
ncbi:DUF3379 family protein [Vibrio casei]|uniref:DUF3379 family protein n=1 Tax=Vibrio casei TaxID=673372 RepID=A0A368LPC7_9VIBR|nr:DUF3379 family protein [Vibrio casei]RCS73616.1 DUF3379 family protein [Vibrio casei]SJN16855.1 hypothetical protein FM109_00880 [Vibrio casei]